MKRIMSIITAALLAAVSMNTISAGAEPAYQVGDVNHDGVIDILDALMILDANTYAMSVYSETGELKYSDGVMADFELYDVDGNGRIDGKDASLVLASKENADQQIGDVNHDGFIDSIDASMILEANADAMSVYAETGKLGYSDKVMADFELYDVDGNGMIDGVDASLVLSYNLEQA